MARKTNSRKFRRSEHTRTYRSRHKFLCFWTFWSCLSEATLSFLLGQMTTRTVRRSLLFPGRPLWAQMSKASGYSVTRVAGIPLARVTWNYWNFEFWILNVLRFEFCTIMAYNPLKNQFKTNFERDILVFFFQNFLTECRTKMNSEWNFRNYRLRNNQSIPGFLRNNQLLFLRFKI